MPSKMDLVYRFKPAEGAALEGNEKMTEMEMAVERMGLGRDGGGGEVAQEKEKKRTKKEKKKAKNKAKKALNIPKLNTNRVGRREEKKQKKRQVLVLGDVLAERRGEKNEKRMGELLWEEAMEGGKDGGELESDRVAFQTSLDM
ncbi:hypothetical protein IFR05_006037 [Cadophora sp. M221]|nr:hypothetical protein IFR05_006037 [Cadophora sp. M221]